MPNKAISRAYEIAKIGKALTCNEQISSIQICATECFDREQNGTGCPGFYTVTDSAGAQNCHICYVSNITEIQTSTYTNFSGNNLVYLFKTDILPAEVPVDFEQLSAANDFINGTNTTGTTTNILDSDHVNGIKGKGFYIHDGAKVYLTGSEQECWTNLEHCESGISMSIWLKVVTFGDSYIVGTGVILQRGFALFVNTAHHIQSVLTLDTERFDTALISSL